MLEPAVTGEFSPQPEIQLARITPPAARAALLPRLRVDQLLAGAAETPLTILAAPAGFGKSVALARLARRGGWQAAWCRCDPADTPPMLARHIAAACAAALPPPVAADLDRRAASDPSGARLVAALLNALAATLDDDMLLVLDDYHHADARPELREIVERAADALPPRLHLLLSSRALPALDAAARARARGDLLLLRADELAMTVGEAHALFGLAGRAIPPEIASLHAQAAGWPLALRLLVESAPRQPALSYGPIMPTIDAFLAREVLAPLPEPLAALLLDATALPEFDRAACAALLPPGSPPSLIDALERTQLMAPPGGEGPFSIPLLAEFLRRAAAQRGDMRGAHLRLAAHYRESGSPERAIAQLIAAGEPAQAARLLEGQAPAWLASGRADRLLSWAARLPVAQRAEPGVLMACAAAARHMGQFDQALADYAAAERELLQRGDDQGRAQALRGQAEIYLDLVQPAPAVGLLKQALKLLPRERAADRSALLRMQAENWANRGRADVALLLEQAARRTMRAAAGPAPSAIAALPGEAAGPPPPRLLLRAGRLREARAQLEQELGLDPRPSRPRADQPLHREPQLLLAFIDTLLGNGARALALARRGLLEAQQGGSRLTEAIAQMRLGHALQISAPRDQAALRAYERALALIQAAGVARTRAEAYLGLTLLHGHGGDLAAAEQAAQSGIQLAESAGDAWIAALIWLALGGGAVAAGDPRGPGWVERARALLQRGHDSYGLAIASLWLAIDHLRHGRAADLTVEWRALLAAVERDGHYGLFTSPTLLGPRDMATLIPLLLHGRSAALRDTPPALVAEQILRHAYPAIAADELVDTYHPGFTLRVQMLGGFRVWRGAQEIQSREWQREKSRQLLQLLLNQRGQWLQREQICAWLWPDSDIEAAERQFKVTLNALNVALEPRRPPRTPPFFIRRQGLAYSFAPSYGCWIDVDEFELRLAGLPQPDPDLALRNSRIATQLYLGDYLPELLYEPWTMEERERLLARYLAAATDLAARLYARGDHAEAIEQCEQVLRRDRCYEEAYQILICAHAAAGSRSQALRAFARCAHALESELGIEPLPETYALHERIRQNQPIDGAPAPKSL